MRNLYAAVYFLLQLFGCAFGGTTLVERSTIGGIDQIHSRIRIQSDITRFECVASASGECHYTLFPRPCASATGDCAQVERFAMPAGASREVVGMPEFSACVTQSDTALAPDCNPARAQADR